MTCKDCVHYEACLEWATNLFGADTQIPYKAEKCEDSCNQFKQKSRFVELPCEVGQTVWFETWEKNGSVCIGVQPHTVDKIEIACVVGMNKFVPTRLEDWRFGKTVFLSKEEAEKALAERSK
jgi:hypothetical protein